jgi:hypothetical protein
VKVLLGYFNANLGGEGTFKLTTENQSLDESGNDMGLKQYTLPHPKIKLSGVQRSHNPTFLIRSRDLVTTAGVWVVNRIY